MENIISCENLVKIYKTPLVEVFALQGLDLTIQQGELMAIIGSSGSGKSTLLNMIGGLDKPSAGSLFVDGLDLFKLSERQLIEYKRRTVGFVWQNNARNLVPYLTALQNIQMPMMFGLNSYENDALPKNKRERALHLLDLVGMGHRRNNKLQQLSGGEQQRIAIALALANCPKILLADEPTGSVDHSTGEYILDCLRRLCNELGITVVIVTHDVNLSKKVNRVVAIRDGKCSSEMVAIRDVDVGGFVEKEELAVLDKAGRVQIPKEYLERLGLEDNKVKVDFENDSIVIRKRSS